MSEPAMIMPPHRGRPRKKNKPNNKPPALAGMHLMVPVEAKRKIRMAGVANGMTSSEVVTHLTVLIGSEGNFLKGAA